MDVNEVDYIKIGQRIRAARLKLGWQQAEVAFRAGLTTSHMSHIETGNTKLSLPVLVALSNALEIQADDLLSEHPSGRTIAIQELEDLLTSCTDAQIRVILDVVKSTKSALEKYETLRSDEKQ